MDHERCGQKRGSDIGMRQQALDLPSECNVVAAPAREKGRTLVRRPVERRERNRFDAHPSLVLCESGIAAHAPAVAPVGRRSPPGSAAVSSSSRCSHARAIVHVRRTVRSTHGNAWMFRLGHPLDQSLRVRRELLHRTANDPAAPGPANLATATADAPRARPRPR